MPNIRFSTLDPHNIAVAMPTAAVDVFKKLLNVRYDEFTASDWEELNLAIESIAEHRKELSDEEIVDRIGRGYVAKVTPFDVISNSVYIDNEPYDKKKYSFMEPLFNINPKYPRGSRRQVWATSRQVGKSTSQACSMIGHGIINGKTKGLHVSPRGLQARVFSQQRFRPICEQSPKIMGTFVKPALGLWQAMARQFMNGAFFNFRSCYLDADGVRGVTANTLYLDEYQDLPGGDAIKVIESVQLSYPSDETFNYYAGTHKSTANQLNVVWENSSQFEWLIPCASCRFENMTDESIIQKDKYACFKCGKALDVSQGLWVPMQPEFLDKQWGFRICQIMMPHRTHADIIAERDSPTTTRRAFMNEVLAQPYDAGKSGLNRGHIKAACDPDQEMLAPEQILLRYATRGYNIFAGVDYGTGEGVPPSFTVLAIGTVDRAMRVRILYIKKFQGPEADLNSQPARIDQICRMAGVKWLGADWGFGADKNSRLVGEYGWFRQNKQPSLLEFRYTTQSKEAVYKVSTYNVDRNQTMERTIDAVRNHDKPWGLVFPKYEEFRFMEADLTAPVEELNENTGRYKYVHKVPDDGFHAINYLYMAARQHHGLLVPTGLPRI